MDPEKLTAAIACVCLAGLVTSQNILVSWTKRNGAYDYNYITVTAMAEFIKLSMACFLLFRARVQEKRLATHANDLENNDTSGDNAKPTHRPVDLAHEFSLAGFQERLPFALPALIYFAKNNLVFYGLSKLDPVQFQLLGNLKILTTTFLFRVIMKKPLSDLGYLSVLLLTIGLTVTQMKGDQALDVTLEGILIMSLISLLSGLAGIVTEWLMKSNPRRASESLHIQNFWLYFYGVAFNLIAIFTDDYEAIFSKGFFYGYTFTTVCVVINNSLSGLAVSAIMKFANNIVKLFTFAVSLILTTIASIYFFDFHPTLRFFVGSTIVFISIYLYNRKEGGGIK